MANDPASGMTAPAKKFQFVGGNLCLDYCNTMGGKRGVIPREFLNDYPALLSWSEQAGLLAKPQAEKLGRRAARQPGLARNILLRAVALREAIYRIFSALADNHSPPAADVARLNVELARTAGQRLVAASSPRGGFAWRWTDDEALDQALGPVAHSAAELLTSGAPLARVRQCQGQNCGWLFLDCSKNHSRCWCDMRDCGNRAKVRRHRLRQRTGQTVTSDTRRKGA